MRATQPANALNYQVNCSHRICIAQQDEGTLHTGTITTCAAEKQQDRWPLYDSWIVWVCGTTSNGDILGAFTEVKGST